MKTKTNTTKRVAKKEPVKQNSAAVRAAADRELGLKEQVKAGLLTAKQAMVKLAKKVDSYGTEGIKSKTYQWLKNREAREGSSSKVSAQAEAAK